MLGRVRKILLNKFIAQLAVILALVTLFAYLALRDYTIHDFVCYWASAHLLANGRNPYDPAVIQALELSVGTHQNGPPFIMRNPPWMLPLIAPIAWFSLRGSILIWAALMLAMALTSLWLLTRDAPEKRDVFICFAPLLMCLWNGQSTTIVLFAVAFFLSFWKRRPFASGLVLALAVIKAHLLVIFWPLLAIDCFCRRDWRLPAGLGCGVLVLTGAAWWLEPHAWSDYRLAMAGQGIGTQFLPNLSALLRSLFFPRFAWAQLIPSACGIAAALAWYIRRTDWNWSEDGPLLIAASAVLSPYLWTYDLALVLPVVLTVPYTKQIREAVILASLLTILPVEYTRVWASPPMAFAGLVWVAWYLFARYSTSRKAVAFQTAVS